MPQETIAGLVEIAFVFCCAFGLGLWQLISIRREIRKDRENAQRDGREIV